MRTSRRGGRSRAVALLASLLLQACSSVPLGTVTPTRPAGDPSAAASSSPGERPTTYYLAPDGDDAGDGSIDRPWLSAIRASESLQPGDTLLARGGVYRGQGGYGWAASGTEAAPITFAAAPGESPVFDGDGREQWVILSGVHDLVVDGLEIRNYRPVQNGVLLILGESRNITLSRLVMRGNSTDGDPSRHLEHLIYPGAGPIVNLTIRDCRLDVGGLTGAAIHVYHDPGPRNLVVEGNAIENAYWGVLIGSNADGVTVRGNTFSKTVHEVTVYGSASNVTIDQ